MPNNKVTLEKFEISPDSAIDSVMTISEDVTERLRAEQELFGPVAFDPVVSRLVTRLAGNAPAALKAIADAREELEAATAGKGIVDEHLKKADVLIQQAVKHLNDALRQHPATS